MGIWGGYHGDPILHSRQKHRQNKLIQNPICPLRPQVNFHLPFAFRLIFHVSLGESIYPRWLLKKLLALSINRIFADISFVQHAATSTSRKPSLLLPQTRELVLGCLSGATEGMPFANPEARNMCSWTYNSGHARCPVIVQDNLFNWDC